MPGPYEKFETAFETFQEQLHKEIHEELEALKDTLGNQPSLASLTIPAEVVAIQRDLQTIQQKLDVMQHEFHIIEELQEIIEKLQEKPNPLAFYETILKIRSHHGVSNDLRTKDFPKPYFADVFNDVVSYFGGIDTTDPLGRRFIEEAGKRFAYLHGYLPYQGKDLPFLYRGQMNVFSGFAVNEYGWQIGFPLPYGDREFAILRQLLEDIFSEEKPSYIEPAPPKAIISADLANILKSQK